MHGPYGGFEWVARERRRELLEEAERGRLARLARPEQRLRERLAGVARFLAGVRGWFRPRVGEEEISLGGAPSSVYLVRDAGGGPYQAVEVYPGGGGRVVRRTDLRTGASTDSFLADGRLRR